MRVRTIVLRVLQGCSTVVHASRLTTLLVVIEGIVRSSRLAVTSVGRCLPSSALVKHSIKRVDRLLSNGRFQRERHVYFRALARFIIGQWSRPVIAIDWTKAVGNFWALYASVPVGGRAQTVYLEVHPERVIETERVHRRFLRALRDVLPPDCRPIIVLDAGFHGEFLREVRELGWDFLVRLRGRTTMRPSAAHPWTNVRRLYRRASVVAVSLGLHQLYRKVRSIEVTLVLVQQVRSGRHPFTRKLSPDHASTMRGGKDPWLLATSLHHHSAEQVIALYALRMQIEETFRDLKNHRFGWSLRDVRSSAPERLAALLLIASFAMLAVTLIGSAAELAEVHRSYQANTVTRRVLSHFMLGLSVLRASKSPSIHPSHLRAATALLRLPNIGPPQNGR